VFVLLALGEGVRTPLLGQVFAIVVLSTFQTAVLLDMKKKREIRTLLFHQQRHCIPLSLICRVCPWSIEGLAASGRAWSIEGFKGLAASGRAWSIEGLAASGRAWSIEGWAASGRAWSIEGLAVSGRAWSIEGLAVSGRAWSIEGLAVSGPHLTYLLQGKRLLYIFIILYFFFFFF
jgi:hypothetical protein